MSDSEMINLIEHYEWCVYREYNHWNVAGNFGKVFKKTLREAIVAALAAQAKWSLS